MTALLKNIEVEASPKAQPILKWAGGKTQLLPILNNNYPADLKVGDIDTYIEPFVGGGAVYFDIFNKYQIKKAYLLDINPELVVLYESLKNDVYKIIDYLAAYEKTYLELGEEQRKAFYYDVRKEYNAEVLTIRKFIANNPVHHKRAAQTIFLNRTCFNGLFRVNSKHEFNVPMGSYKNPTILFSQKLEAASEALQYAEIVLGDFTKAESFVEGNTFIYYDPPYRPVSKTSQFTSYSSEGFNDDDQVRLSTMFKSLDRLGVKQMLSNSDPSNYIEDPFFDDLYQGFSIQRIDAKRMINSKSANRGALKEILVKNYDETL